MLPYHATSEVFAPVPAARSPTPLPAFANVFADFFPGFADAVAPALFSARLSFATFFFVVASADFAASSESSFLAGEFLFGEDFGAAPSVGWGVGLGGVTLG